MISSLPFHADTTPSRASVVTRFAWDESVASFAQAKSSVQRGVRARILDQYPLLEPVIDDLLPKKSPMFLAKWCVHLRVVGNSLIARSQEHVTLVIIDKEPLFFNHRDGPYMPTLRLLHRCLHPHIHVAPGVVTLLSQILRS